MNREAALLQSIIGGVAQILDGVQEGAVKVENRKFCPILLRILETEIFTFILIRDTSLHPGWHRSTFQVVVEDLLQPD